MFDYEIEGRVLETPDSYTYCRNVRDLRDVMEKYISYDFAEYVSQLINENKADEAYEEARAYTDADAIAEENDALRGQILGVKEILDNIADEILTKTRLNKQDLYLKLVAISMAINEAL